MRVTLPSRGKLILEQLGVAGLFNDVGQVQVGATGQIAAGNNNGSLQIEPNGDVFLDAPSSRSITTSIPVGTTGSGFSQRLQSGAAAGVRGIYNAGDGTMRFADNQAGGNWMKLGDGGGAYKNFVIPHPADPERWLVHACIEAPEGQVEYRGTAVVTGGARKSNYPTTSPPRPCPAAPQCTSRCSCPTSRLIERSPARRHLRRCLRWH